MAITQRMREACARHWRGEASFGRFVLDTRDDWEKLSASVIRRWKIPENRASREDVEQEMLFGAHVAFTKFDPSFGVSIEVYVVWNAEKAGRKKAHKWRGANLHGDACRNPSRMERPFSSFGDDSGGDRSADQVVEGLMLSSGMLVPAESERKIELEERKSRIPPRCQNPVEELALSAILDGLSLDDGARMLYEDPDLCLAYRLGGEEGARRAIRVAASVLAERVELAEDGEVSAA